MFRKEQIYFQCGPQTKKSFPPLLQMLIFSSNYKCFKSIFRDSSTSYTPSPSPSVFRESTLSPAEIANQLRDELKRMRRRRQILGDDVTTSQQRHSPSPPMLGSPYSPQQEFMMDASEASTSQRKQQQQQQLQPVEKPVFTLKQMTLICERMCKVRIREKQPYFVPLVI